VRDGSLEAGTGGNGRRALAARSAALAAAAIIGLLLAIGIGSAGAANQTVTLGSVTGDPTGNVTLGGNVTFLPFSSAANPELQVPFDGTVTSFSVNAGSAGGMVSLRVLRPAANGQFTGAGTGPAETLDTGVNTFTVSIPVKAGDLLGLDNASQALLFDTSQTAPSTAYYSPSLADGQTTIPNSEQTGYRLLLSAIVQATGTTSTVQTTPGATTTQTIPLPPGAAMSAPKLTHILESHQVWRESKKHSQGSGAAPPVGTTFSFTLNKPARVTLTFKQTLTGRKVQGRCVMLTGSNRQRPTCQMSRTVSHLSLSGEMGSNHLAFHGQISAGSTKLLPVGHYIVLIKATDRAGRTSATARLGFSIASS